MGSEKGMHDPYRKWRSGFTFEIIIYSSFTLAMGLLAYLAWAIFG